MTISAAELRELHRLHRQSTDLRDRLARGPKQIKSGSNAVTQNEATLESAKEKLKRTELTLREKELTLKERENRILDIRRKLNSCSSNKEYQAFMEQIAADEQANSVLSDEILELLDKANADKALVTEAEQGVKDAQAQLERIRTKVEKERDGLETELVRVSDLLKQSESNLPHEARQDYQRVVKAHGEDALAAVEGEVCGGCYQRITPQMINELNLERMVFCKTCGRLIYLPEESSAD